MKLIPFLLIAITILSFSCKSKEKAPRISDSTPKERYIRPQIDMINRSKDTICFQKEKYKFIIQETDFEEFLRLYEQYYHEELRPVRITEIDSIRSILKTNVEMYVHEDGDIVIKNIELPNGKKIKLDNNDPGQRYLVSYYPEYDFMLMQGSKPFSDDGYDLITGDRIYEAGNPDDQTISPNKQYRISGIFGGEECYTYVIQKLYDGRFHKISDLEHRDLCDLSSWFWLNDTVFYYSIGSYYYDEYNRRNGFLQYFKLIIEEE